MQVFHHSCFAMGTRFNIVIPCLGNDVGKIIGNDLNKILFNEEERLSCFNPNSEVSQINKIAGKGKTKVSGEMAEIVEVLDKYWLRTGGAFDAGLLNLTMSIKRGELNGDGINGNLAGWENIKWDNKQNEIRITNRLTAIDTGGFGKGWGLEKVVGHLKEIGIESAFLSFGESSVYGLGVHPLSDHWPVEINHPVSGVKLKLKLNNSSLSVSGLQECYKNDIPDFVPHIISPATGKPVFQNSVVVAVGSSPVDTEILSTAVMASVGQGIQLIVNEFKNVAIYKCWEDDLEFKELKFNHIE